MANKTDSVRLSQEITEKQRRAIPYLIAAKDVESGCRDAKITPTTYYDWIRNNNFETALQTARNEIINGAMLTLKSHVGQAVNELAKLLTSSNEEIRRKTANNIIELSLRWHEAGEIENRLEEIERIIIERRTYK